MEPLHGYRHQPPLHALQWKRHFTIRRTTLYHGQDNRLRVPLGGSAIDEFFKNHNINFAPPRRYELLRKFLGQNSVHLLQDEAKLSPSDQRVLAMVDDRCDPCLNIPESASFQPMRQWGLGEYMNRPPQGLHARIYGMNAAMLYQHLSKNRKGVAERRVVYLVDITPLMGLALLSNVSYMQLSEVRSFLSRHVAFASHMGVSQARGFTLEFHLPHHVLRPNRVGFRDGRGLRRYRSLRPFESNDDDCIYEAQLSLIVLGVDDFFWVAYFCEDSYFRSVNPITEHLEDEVDGPSFGLRQCQFPVWDPRYYFLSVLSIRMSQVLMEWTVLVESIENDLDKHADIGQGSIDKFLEDDPSLRKTKEYTWILGTLRHLRNSLARLIATWTAFDTNNRVYFDLDVEGALCDKFREHFYEIRQVTAELGTLQMVLEQRIETLEKRSSVLVTASSLAESITATRQGDNIRLLTYITIIYLPVTLVTSAFSMNQVSTDIAWWKYWTSLLCLTCFTVAVAFGLQSLVPRLRHPNLNVWK
ncbi:hypothetical protein FE257_003049 [Aspergillus nanangensis]|uniref:Uncharacterized protein n=1 Tax=Aspergillus nanangensis TaxID=2582783 RepID=A0AAD4CC29_ASPNN|nr:hypothetical protein FE257_003049 [Aspergillus nanangensis]